jgi:hypothetical protein
MNGFAEMMDQMLSPGWEVYESQSGSDRPAQCPHGHLIEKNGRYTTEGRVNPLTSLGMI